MCTAFDMAVAARLGEPQMTDCRQLDVPARKGAEPLLACRKGMCFVQRRFYLAA